jgi:hypothetical protein
VGNKRARAQNRRFFTPVLAKIDWRAARLFKVIPRVHLSLKVPQD